MKKATRPSKMRIRTKGFALPKKKCLFIRQTLLAWSHDHTRDFPWRHLGTSSPYCILIAELLLKRTTARAAARAYEGFVQKYPTPSHLALATEVELANDLRPLGLYRQRARNIVQLAAYLTSQESGTIPPSLERLLKFPGLGDYGARAILSFGFGIPAAVVDGNVVRVIQRTFHDILSDRPDRAVIQALADSFLLGEDHRHLNFAVLDFGALVCRPSSPKCGECPLCIVCDYHRAGENVRHDSALRDLRVRMGLSLAVLSSRSGVSKTTLINIEAGHVSPRQDTLRALANALGVETSAVMPYNEAAGVMRRECKVEALGRRRVQ